MAALVALAAPRATAALDASPAATPREIVAIEARLPAAALRLPPTAAQDTGLAPAGTRWRLTSAGMPLVATVVTRDIEIPFGLTFLPDGRALATDRTAGRLLLVSRAGAVTVVQGVPAVNHVEDGGLLDVQLDPSFARTGRVYFTFTEDSAGSSWVAVERARLVRDSLVDRVRLYTARPALARGTQHGGRLLLTGGFLYVALGDHGPREQAQDLRSPWGKVLRLAPDGAVPPDNPFAGRGDALPEIWTLGHRNPHGFVVHPQTGALWEVEHGPKGGDEVNILARGANYGWPVITYGREYKGPLINDGLEVKDGMEQPVHYWVPSIAPGGAAFYASRALPAWTGSLFVGAMGKRHLARLEFRDGRMVLEEKLFLGHNWRVRAVAVAPDGALWFGVDGGMLVRVARAR
ncbi:MAG: PQQ-dependent sugar dehydrogenase [Gemmatimonadetes bacterium]|nr:PQQ-dependent sugar dehydrogenase [Gemmatimonadota bacterium]